MGLGPSLRRLLLLTLLLAPGAGPAAAAQAPVVEAPPITSAEEQETAPTAEPPETAPPEVPNAPAAADESKAAPPIVEVPAPGSVPPPATDSAVPAPGAPVVVPPGAVIGEVRVVTHSIFDPTKPGENRRLFRLADRLHRTTRPEVISRQLLFKSGDPFSPELLAESERLLRANRYLYDAKIRPLPVEPPAGEPTAEPTAPKVDVPKVDVEVETRDLWTLRASVGASRAGGENSTSIALEDKNFLGTGKDLTAWRMADVDRTSELLRFRDPHLFGSRAQLEVSYSDYSDGDAQRFELERPFFALDSRWAAGFKAWRYDRLDSLYDAGEVFDRFRHQRDWLEVYGGLSPGATKGSARRLEAGLTFERNRFDFQPGGDSDSLVPPDRTLAYPWIGYESIVDGYVAERDLDQIQRTEDLNLGRQIHLRLGGSTRSFGADADELIFDGSVAAGWRPGGRQLLLLTAQGGTRYGSSGAQNLLVGGKGRWYVRDFGRHLFYAAVEGDFARRLDAENQLLLGGDSGLRGYPLRYQQGDRRALVTLEQRFFGSREYFHLARLGGAVFFDGGRAWFEGSDSARYQKVLKDVGVGLRIGSSRSAEGTVVHLDLAFPLDADPSIKRVQWLVLTSDSF